MARRAGRDVAPRRPLRPRRVAPETGRMRARAPRYRLRSSGARRLVASRATGCGGPARVQRMVESCPEAAERREPFQTAACRPLVTNRAEWRLCALELRHVTPRARDVSG